MSSVCPSQLLLAGALALGGSGAGAQDFELVAQLAPSAGAPCTGSFGSVCFGSPLAFDGTRLASTTGSKGNFPDTDSVNLFLDDGGWSEEASLTLFTASQNDEVAALAIDGTRLAMGLPWALSNTINGGYAGDVVIARFDGSSWGLEALLTAFDPQGSDRFGTSLWLGGDLLLVGAIERRKFAADGGPGSVYAFAFDGTQWVGEAHISSPDGFTGDQFGASLAMDGNRAVVGAPNHDRCTENQGLDEGAAYVFLRSAGTWSLEQKLVGSDFPAVTNRRFGTSVAIDGDLVAVGTSLGYSIDEVHLFRRDGGWQPEAVLSAPSVSLSVGPDTVVVGYYGEVRIYRHDASGWNLTQVISAPDPTVPFGSLVSLSGNRLAVGALGGGAVYVYEAP